MPDYDKVESSGNIENQPGSNARRDSRTGKGRFDLISPHTMHRIAKHFESGAVKYGDNNWVHGMNFSRYLDSAERHINCWKLGMKNEDHLAAAIWNLMAIVDHEERIEKGLMDPKFADMPLNYEDFNKKT